MSPPGGKKGRGVGGSPTDKLTKRPQDNRAQALELGMRFGWFGLPLRMNAEGKWTPRYPYTKPEGPFGDLRVQTWHVALWERLWEGHEGLEGLGIVWPADLVMAEADSDEGEEWLRKLTLPRTPTFGSRRGPHYLFRGSGEGIDPSPHQGVEVLSTPDKVLLVLPPTPPKAWWPSLSVFEVDPAPLPAKLKRAGPTKNGHRERVRLTAEPILEGGRTKAMTSIAGKFVQTLYPDEAFAAATAYDAAHCRPPLGEKRLRRMVEDFVAKDAAKGEKNWWGTEGQGFVPPKLGEHAERAGHLRIGPGGSLWRYLDGVYIDDGEEWLAELVRDELGERFRRNRLTEVRAWCLAHTSAKLNILPPADVINVANGTLHWRENPPRLEPHDPGIASFVQVPVAWDPKATCPAIFAFLERVLDSDDLEAHRALLLEWIGHLLVPRNRYKKSLLAVGPGDTGKSTLMRLIEALLGERNVSHVTLQSITDDRFGAADLFGKLANISADLDATALKKAGMFKALTGDDTVRIEKKYHDAFSARLFVKLMFSANEAPGTADQSDAFYSRWIILPMRRKLAEDEQQPNLIEKMTTPEELSGLLLHAVANLRELTVRGRFQEPEAVRLAGAEYRTRTDTVRGYVEDRCELEPEGRTTETQLFEDYTEWCHRSNRHGLGKARFKEHLQDVYPIVEWRKKYSGYPTWFGIRIEGALP